ncbi:putative sugar transporter STL1 [Rhexocercosporidium sp. MPI-PUGE-AT-0058]|nr:putative sugar transporter STL1 [Rhexocercosporidium sp. MPI-PUGE-AT-0058]
MPLRGHKLSVAQLALVVAPSFVLFGYNQAGVGGLLSLPNWTKTFPEIDTTNTTGAEKSHNATIQGTVVATFVLGALVGSLACMKIGNILGRRKSIFLAATLTLIGEALCTSSFGLPQFIVGRTIIGLGIGILSATVPVWQAECSSAANRGKHVVLDGLFMTLGYTLESWINLGASQIKSGPNISASWRMPLGIPLALSLLLMGTIFTMPESPRWLISVNRVEEARTILANLKDTSVTDSLITAEIEGIQYSLEESTVKKASIADMFTMGPEKLFYRFCLCILLQFYQQMMGSCMLALAIATSYPKENKSAGIASVCFVFLFNFFVPIGFLGANFLYCAEVAPVKLRVSMAAISTANHWLWNFVVVMATPVAIASIGNYYFVLFCVISFCIPLSVYFFYPETMGQSLEQIDAVFRDNRTPLTIVRASKLLAKGDVGAIYREKQEEKMVENVIASKDDRERV